MVGPEVAEPALVAVASEVEVKDLREAIVEAIETLTEALAGVEDDEGEMAPEDEGEMESEDEIAPPALVAALRRRDAE